MPVEVRGARKDDNGDVYKRRMFTRDKIKHNSIMGGLGAIFGVIVVVVIFAGVFNKDVNFSPTGGLSVTSSQVSLEDTSNTELVTLIKLNADAIQSNAESIKYNTKALKSFKSSEDQRHYYLEREINLKFNHIKESLADIKSLVQNKK